MTFLFLPVFLHIVLDFLFPFPFTLLSFAAFVLLFFAGLELIVDANFFEIVVSKQEREVVFTIATNAQNVFILFLRQRRVLRVHVLHDVSDLLGI